MTRGSLIDRGHRRSALGRRRVRTRFFFGGCYAVSLALPTPRMRQVLGGAAGLALISGGRLLFTWLALTGGGADGARAIRPGSLVLGRRRGVIVACSSGSSRSRSMRSRSSPGLSR